MYSNRQESSNPELKWRHIFAALALVVLMYIPAGANGVPLVQDVSPENVPNEGK